MFSVGIIGLFKSVILPTLLQSTFLIMINWKTHTKRLFFICESDFSNKHVNKGVISVVQRLGL